MSEGPTIGDWTQYGWIPDDASSFPARVRLRNAAWMVYYEPDVTDLKEELLLLRKENAELRRTDSAETEGQGEIMTEIERRNRLVGQESAKQTYGEGFIAVHMKDGGVVTISGIVDMVEKKADMEDHISWHGDRVFLDVTGWNVTVHFVGNIVEEYRPLDGKEVAK